MAIKLTFLEIVGRPDHLEKIFFFYKMEKYFVLEKLEVMKSFRYQVKYSQIESVWLSIVWKWDVTTQSEVFVVLIDLCPLNSQ